MFFLNFIHEGSVMGESVRAEYSLKVADQKMSSSLAGLGSLLAGMAICTVGLMAEQAAQTRQ